MRVSTKQVSDTPIVQRILRLLDAKKASQKDLTTYLGVSDTVFTSWKFKDGTSYMDYIGEIASFFNVTPTYLINGEECREEISMVENNLLKMYRAISDSKKEVVNEILAMYYTKAMDEQKL